jgi:glucokinase
MENTNNDSWIVLTLDAGGTNFVFSTIQGNKEIINPIHYPSYARNLDKCLGTIIKGFTQAEKKIPGRACSISFAFPGPAD